MEDKKYLLLIGHFLKLQNLVLLYNKVLVIDNNGHLLLKVEVGLSINYHNLTEILLKIYNPSTLFLIIF